MRLRVGDEPEQSSISNLAFVRFHYNSCVATAPPPVITNRILGRYHQCINLGSPLMNQAHQINYLKLADWVKDELTCGCHPGDGTCTTCLIEAALRTANLLDAPAQTTGGNMTNIEQLLARLDEIEGRG